MTDNPTRDLDEAAEKYQKCAMYGCQAGHAQARGEIDHLISALEYYADLSSGGFINESINRARAALNAYRRPFQKPEGEMK